MESAKYYVGLDVSIPAPTAAAVLRGLPGTLGWSEHQFVLKDGRVYDVLKGPAGMPTVEYKALWGECR